MFLNKTKVLKKDVKNKVSHNKQFLHLIQYTQIKITPSVLPKIQTSNSVIIIQEDDILQNQDNKRVTRLSTTNDLQASTRRTRRPVVENPEETFLTYKHKTFCALFKVRLGVSIMT